MDGVGGGLMKVSCTLHFRGNERLMINIFEKELRNKSWLMYRYGQEFDMQCNKKVKTKN